MLYTILRSREEVSFWCLWRETKKPVAINDHDADHEAEHDADHDADHDAEYDAEYDATINNSRAAGERRNNAYN